MRGVKHVNVVRWIIHTFSLPHQLLRCGFCAHIHITKGTIILRRAWDSQPSQLPLFCPWYCVLHDLICAFTDYGHFHVYIHNGKQPSVRYWRGKTILKSLMRQGKVDCVTLLGRVGHGGFALHRRYATTITSKHSPDDLTAEKRRVSC